MNGMVGSRTGIFAESSVNLVQSWIFTPADFVSAKSLQGDSLRKANLGGLYLCHEGDVIEESEYGGRKEELGDFSNHSSSTKINLKGRAQWTSRSS
jgi:hypothetical protein